MLYLFKVFFLNHWKIETLYFYKVLLWDDFNKFLKKIVFLEQKPDMDVAVKTIMKKNIPKTQSLLKKEIDILRVIIYFIIPILSCVTILSCIKKLYT